MLLIYCPYCEEERSELEFRNAGDAHIVRPANMPRSATRSSRNTSSSVRIRKGLSMKVRHIHGCGRFFNAARDTVSDRFHVTYKAGEPKPDLNAEPKTSETVETYEALEGVAE